MNYIKFYRSAVEDAVEKLTPSCTWEGHPYLSFSTQRFGHAMEESVQRSLFSSTEPTKLNSSTGKEYTVCSQSVTRSLVELGVAQKWILKPVVIFVSPEGESLYIVKHLDEFLKNQNAAIALQVWVVNPQNEAKDKQLVSALLNAIRHLYKVNNKLSLNFVVDKARSRADMTEEYLVERLTALLSESTGGKDGIQQVLD